MRRILLILIATLFIPLGGNLLSEKANAIVFGQDVTNASSSYPYVVSIWWTEDQDEDFEHACTGTLITDRLVLTAAHCVFDTGLIGVGYGDDQLYDKTPMRRVSAVWKHPRFSNKQKVNDVGLILLADALPFAQTLDLPTKSQLAGVVGKSGTTYEILGWGLNQNEEEATYLRKAKVSDQTSLAKSIKGWQPWRNDVWFAVGKWLPKERVFAGACYGDSGGPLIAIKNGKSYLAGVASWGSQDCETNRPSVYTRLSYYLGDIKAGMSQILVNEQKQNRALPTVITNPTITGDITALGRVTCNPGTWSSNTESTSFTWTLNGFAHANGQTLRLGSGSSSNQVYKCIVTASNANGSTTATAQITLLAKPLEISRPTVQGVPTTTFFVANSTATCTPASFQNAKSSTSDWWLTTSSFSNPEEKLTSASNLLIDSNFALKYGGKYLVCVTTASGDGGISISTSYSWQIPRLAKPSFETYPRLSGVSAARGIKVGETAKCDGWKAAGSIQSSSVAWYVGTYFLISSNSSTPKVGTNSEIAITSELLNTYANRYLFCEVTLVNAAGATTQSSDAIYLYVSQVSTPSPTPTPTISVRPSPTPSPTQTNIPSQTPTPTPSPQSIAEISGVTITSSSTSFEPTLGTTYTCNVQTTNTNHRGIYIKWRNSNLPDLGSYRSPFTEREWNGGLSNSSTNTLVVSSEMISDLKGNYLECAAIVYAIGGGQSGGWVMKKVKLP